ncbi:hypothetical protein CDV31_000246 [Fusarium ambrosium]|uniref:Uncharacterized protein n=1 Tax=Fusarium ambrosium TaxID=131363 RepID=A0A428V2V6_9HYPO|nr:hypothetical protein CDV31_000246 [Fusarium ambrosium]
MSSPNYLTKLSPDVLLVLCEFLETNDLLSAAQVKVLNQASTWTLHYQDVKYGWGRPKRHTRALSWGCFKGYETVVTRALRMKSSIAESPFFDGKDFELNGNAMHVAASQGHNHILQILLDHGGDINSWTRSEKISVAPFWAPEFRCSMSPLYNAINKKHKHTVMFLLDKGASLVVEKPDFSRPCIPSSQRRLNALHIAAKYGQDHLVRYLAVEYGIGIDLPDQGGNTALSYAMESSENLPVIQYLISEGADPNLMDDEGFTPLHRAMTFPDVEEAKLIVTALIEAGADMDAFNNGGHNTPITMAIRFAQSELITMLVDAGALVDAFHLRLALNDPQGGTRNDAPACVDALLRRGIPEGSEDHVKRFLQEDNAEAAEILYSHGIGLPDESPEGIDKLFQVILDLEPTDDDENESLTFLITHYGDVIRGSEPEEVIAKLLTSGHICKKGIVSLMNPSINTNWRGEKDKTLLHILADDMEWHTLGSDFSLLHALLDHGIDVNAREKDGLTALHLLIKGNNLTPDSDEVWFTEVLDLLLAKGLDINAVDNRGWTALHYLANSLDFDSCMHLVGALVQRGIDADARDTVASRTAFDVSLEKGEKRQPWGGRGIHRCYFLVPRTRPTS